MANVTKKGHKLARAYSTFCGAELGLADLEACSLIARHATSLHHVFEAQCNGHPACSSPLLSTATINRLQQDHEAWCEKREQQLKARIAELARSLPGIKGVRFQGDPRGCPVHLVTENGQGDSWSEPGAIVV